jgi:hypothetical protein
MGRRCARFYHVAPCSPDLNPPGLDHLGIQCVSALIPCRSPERKWQRLSVTMTMPPLGPPHNPRIVGAAARPISTAARATWGSRRKAIVHGQPAKISSSKVARRPRRQPELRRQTGGLEEFRAAVPRRRGRLNHSPATACMMTALALCGPSPGFHPAGRWCRNMRPSVPLLSTSAAISRFVRVSGAVGRRPSSVRPSSAQVWSHTPRVERRIHRASPRARLRRFKPAGLSW